MRYLFFFGVLLLLGLPLMAQLNESDTLRFQWRGTLTGNDQHGNVEVFTLRSKMDAVYAPVKDWVFKSQNNSLYQSFYGKKADNDLFSRNYLYFRPQQRIYPFAIAYVSANYRRKVKGRWFAGAGLTWQAVNQPSAVIKFSASLVQEQTRFRGTVYNEAAYNGSDRIRCWRGTLYTAGWGYLSGKKIRWYYDAFYQPAFDNGRNYRAQADLGVDLPLWRGLSFTTLYTFTHENVVIDKVRKEDRILSFGFSWNLRAMHRSKVDNL